MDNAKVFSIFTKAYKTVRLIAKPSASVLVYEVIELCSNRHFALKLDYEQNGNSLFNESRVLSSLRERLKKGTCNSSEFVPLYEIDQSFHDHRALISELLGPNLLTFMLTLCPNGVLSDVQLRKFASRAMILLQYVHGKGYLHNDIKPANFAFPLRSARCDLSSLKIFDFGCSERWRNSQGQHVSSRYEIQGTLPFLSVYVHSKECVSRRDDLISVGYILPYLASSSLPWLDVTDADEMLSCKRQYGIEKLALLMPKALQQSYITFMSILLGLSPTEEPPYSALARLWLPNPQPLPSHPHPSPQPPHPVPSVPPQPLVVETNPEQPKQQGFSFGGFMSSAYGLISTVKTFAFKQARPLAKANGPPGNSARPHGPLKSAHHHPPQTKQMQQEGAATAFGLSPMSPRRSARIAQLQLQKNSSHIPTVPLTVSPPKPAQPRGKAGGVKARRHGEPTSLKKRRGLSPFHPSNIQLQRKRGNP